MIKIFCTGEVAFPPSLMEKCLVLHSLSPAELKTSKGDIELLNLRFATQIEAEILAEKSGAECIVCENGVITLIADALRQHVPVKQEWRDWSHSYNHVYVFSQEKAFVSASHYYYVQQAIMDECRMPYEIITGTEHERSRAIEGKMEAVMFSHKKERF